MPIPYFFSSASPLLELDPLRQRQLLAVVDGASAAPHVLFPGVGARLPPSAGGLVAAEGAANLGAVRGNVDVDDAAV